MYTKGDFHVHTTASDGELTPEDLILYIKDNHLADIIAVTDHDTTSGIETAMKIGKDLGIKVIPGIELSALYNDESIHILGYFRDDSYKNSEFQKFLKDITDFRIYRARKITENLRKFFSIDIDYNYVLKISKGVVARPHIARAIIQTGYNYSWDYIFENIIGKDSPAYVHNKKVSVEEGIAILKEVNALVILAHPVLIKRAPIDELLKFDFDGIEAFYYLNADENTNFFIEKALEYNKLVSAGSDFHTLNTTDTKHGTVGNVYLEGLYLDAFLKKMNIK